MCGNTFLAYKDNHSGGRGIKTYGNIKSSRCITCSRSCSRRYANLSSN